MIEEAVNQLRHDLKSISLPELAGEGDVPLSALYRFRNGQDVKLATLLNIEKAVAKQKGAEVQKN